MNYFFLFLLLVSPLFGNPLDPQRPPLHIAFVGDENSPKYFWLREKFLQELSDLLDDEYALTFSAPNAFVGHRTKESIQQALNNAYEDEDVDAVVVLGSFGSHLVSQRKQIPKPTIAPFIIDSELQHLPKQDEGSGVINLNYLAFPTNFDRDIDLFQELVPFRKAAFFVDETLFDYLPEVMKSIVDLGREKGVAIEFVPIGDSIDAAVASLPSDAEVAYIAPLPRLLQEEIQALATGLNEKKIPTFSLFGKGYVDEGFLVSSAPDSSIQRVARRTALNLQQSLMGFPLSQLSTEIPRENQITINMATAKQLDISPSWEFLLFADTLFTHKEDVPKLSLPQAVAEGLTYNFSLLAEQRFVLAGREEVLRALSRLWPQIDTQLEGRIIRKEVAALSRGLEPERALIGRSTLSQVIYSNVLFGDLYVQTYLQKARMQEYLAFFLDTTFDITRAFLNVLRAKTLERIQINNLRLTQFNLKLAQQRVRVGVARLSEVYRWESQISSNRADVVESHVAAENVSVDLNRLLNRPQDWRCPLEEVPIDAPYLILQDLWIDRNIRSDKTLDTFASFATLEGFLNSPEIQELEERIHAQQEVLEIAKRAFYAPDLFFDADIGKRFYQSGAGSRELFSQIKTDWRFGINATFPLYQGGEKCADKRQAFQNLVRLKYQWAARAQDVEQRIRISIQNASGSYESIGLSEDAERAAKKNLDLVTQSYAQGTTTIIDLLDAQSQALNAELVTANAIYDFLVDLMELQRSIGRFDFQLSQEQIACWKAEWATFQEGY